MCVQNILNWFKPDPVIPQTPSAHKILAFAINDYPGTNHDLELCIKDQETVLERLEKVYGKNYWEILKFRNDEVTKARFLGEIEAAILVLRPDDVLFIHYSGHGTQVYDIHGDEDDGYDEALAVHNGVIINKDIHGMLSKIPEGSYVTLGLDCCHSGTITNPRSLNIRKPKFLPVSGHKPRHTKVREFAKTTIYSNWVTFSACGENEVAYDGAFTPLWMKILDPRMKNWEWQNKLTEFLPSDDFPQSPTLEGKTELLDRIILT